MSGGLGVIKANKVSV